MRFIVPLLLLLAGWSPPPAKVRLLDKLSLVLTGELPAQDMIESYITEQKTLAEIADELKDSEKFERNLGYFYQEKLLITEPIDFVGLYSHPLRAFKQEINKENKIHFKWRTVEGKRTVFNVTADTLPAEINEYAEQLRSNQQLSRHMFYRENHYVMKLFAGRIEEYEEIIKEGAEGRVNGQSINDDLQEDYAELFKILQEAELCYKDEYEVEARQVQPYWDKTKTVKICPAVFEDRFCGANLEKCFPYVLAPGDLDRGNFYRRKVAAAITLEPGRIMAKNVREEKKYSEILTTSKGVVNGYYLHFLKNFGEIVLKSFQQDIFGGEHIVSVNELNSYPELDSMESDISDPNFYWIERGSDKHAGVLTTIAFHRATNGWRAKANKARSALLCREFVDPANTKPDPADKRRLEERTYCGGCHQYLEPMARFFYRWPDTGNDNNYFYDYVMSNPADRNDELRAYYKDTSCSECNNIEGNGIKDFATILATHEDNGFRKCAIKHAFEFIVRRPMTSNEYKNLTPQLLKVYQDNDEKIWKVMQKIIALDAFMENVDVAP